MRVLFSFLLISLLPFAAAAQSQLPECLWFGQKHNCVGTLTYTDGMYVGEFKDGKPNGQGTYTYANGNKYVGEYKDGKPNGQGTFNYAYAKYVGGVKDDKADGQGTFNHANGDKYTGAYVNDKRNGQGTLTFANGNKYVGEFKDNYFNGQGIEYASSGSITKQGRWVNNNLVQSFAIDTQRFPFNSPLTALSTQAPAPDPLKAERDRLTAVRQSQLPECSSAIFRHDCFDTQIFPNGAKYVGEFKGDKQNGQGIAYTSSGSIVSQGRWGLST